MGRLKPGIKMTRARVIETAEEAMKRADRNKQIINNMVMYNAAMHRKLAEELCVCNHGASRHFGPEPNICNQVDCTCTGYRSNHSAKFKEWRDKVRVEMDGKHGMTILESTFPEAETLKAFDNGVTPEAFANELAEELTKPKDEQGLTAAQHQDSKIKVGEVLGNIAEEMMVTGNSDLMPAIEALKPLEGANEEGTATPTPD